ncbi:MAG: XdhC/CoxI family protein [Ferruginibacter sp.]|nr:XdhC/CoxI family protein [Ferruginibacter sp.]
MQIWEFIHQKLIASHEVILLCVIESKGSSPGRRGFKMAVSSDDDFTGTIGGGIMEFKLVEKAKYLLQNKVDEVSVMEQFHDKEHSSQQSGMICSGSQKIAFVPINHTDFNTIKVLKESRTDNQKCFQLSPNGIEMYHDTKNELVYISQNEWEYREVLNQRSVIHIIGGGHISLALSEMMHMLNFYVHVYDDRKDLNTFHENDFADEKHLIDYTTIKSQLKATSSDFVVIMTIGYRTDKLVLKQIIDQSFYYIGMLGSENKIKIMFDELREEGFNSDYLDKVFAPVGINIYSQTTKEIAVSISAEIIKEKNKVLPSGRGNK